jgi:PleD family two-component response regulator
MHLAYSGGDRGEIGAITASVGMAVRQSDESAESLFKRADAALYEAKHGGRNQVRIAV